MSADNNFIWNFKEYEISQSCKRQIKTQTTSVPSTQERTVWLNRDILEWNRIY